MLNLLRIQPLRAALPVFVAAPLVASEPTTPAPAPADAAAAPGCGWFDSSHELQHGLSVQEHVSADTLGAEMQLASWLALQLAGWRATLPAA